MLPKWELRYRKDNFISLNGEPVRVEEFIKHNSKDTTRESITQDVSKNWKISNPAARDVARGDYVAQIFTPTDKDA